MITTSIDGLTAQIPGTRSRLLSFELILVSVPFMILMPVLLVVFPVILWLQHADVALRLDRRRLSVEQGSKQRSWSLEELASVRWEPWDQRRPGRGGQRAGPSKVALIVRERSGEETVFPGLLRHADEEPTRADYELLCARLQRAIEGAIPAGTAAEVPDALLHRRPGDGRSAR